MAMRLSRRGQAVGYIDSALVRLSLNSTRKAMYAVDMAGNCTSCSSACLRLIGRTDPVEVIGKNMHSLLHHTRPDGQPYPKEECPIHLALWRGESSHVDGEFFWRADGANFPVEYWSHPIRENNVPVGALVTFVAATERRRAEDALQQSSEMFRQLAENIPEILFIMTPDPPRMDYVSPAYEEITGRLSQELYEHVDGWVGAVHPEDRSHVLNVFEQAMQALPTAVEYRLIRSDGSVRWINATSFPLEDSQRKLCRIIWIAEDVTDRNRAREETEAARAAAEAASRARSEFQAKLSVELRTQLNSILGMTDLLSETKLTPEQTEYLEMLKASAHSLMAFLSDV